MKLRETQSGPSLSLWCFARRLPMRKTQNSIRRPPLLVLLSLPWTRGEVEDPAGRLQAPRAAFLRHTIPSPMIPPGWCRITIRFPGLNSSAWVLWTTPTTSSIPRFLFRKLGQTVTRHSRTVKSDVDDDGQRNSEFQPHLEQIPPDHDLQWRRNLQHGSILFESSISRSDRYATD